LQQRHTRAAPPVCKTNTNAHKEKERERTK
jgi:hypothetical protein